jgi:Leucine-rich repeat (LRR) protein
MPESISHLIPERVGSMFLDKQNNIWIKRKESYTAREMNILPSEDSEEDPFASIPDLSVDLTKELQGLKISATSRPETAGSASPLPNLGETVTSSPHSQPSRGYVTLSPNARLSPDLVELTREEFEKLDARASEDDQDETNHDLEASAVKDRHPGSATRRRNMTISFSSPIASIIHDVAPEDLDNLEDDDSINDGNLSALRTTEDGNSKLRSHGRGLSQRAANRGPAFIPRPVSRIDEQDEDSTVELPMDEQRQLSIIGETSIMSHKTPNGRRTSLSFIVNHTPGNMGMAVHADDSAVIGHNVGKLSLSPLSEFTLNNSDQSFGFEVSYVMGYRHMATGGSSQKVMSMTIRELVDKLSEVEPCEPYWEDLTELDLHGKRLSSLHMLDEFCGKVVTLDASQNALGHLEGVPSSVRQLKVSQNMLTELTSWDHLMNLQYVDISNNEVRSLSALKNLVHLRSIKADNNQLTTLDGLDVHDGLLSLRARNNLIELVDFGSVRLERLTELDLENNHISSVENLELAPALANLRLAKNKLRALDLTYAPKTFRHLDVSDNELTTLDLGSLQNLHSLHADRNHITTLTGCQRARRLDSLSLREQRGGDGLDLGFLSSACEVRKLFLSGNYLGTFEPQADFLNLQLLELANCGLQVLPPGMGQLMPNLRSLNLNFNAIANLSSLQYIPRLKKLLVAGNRLADSTLVMELLTDFPHLAQLDLRDNPVTLGFYAPIQVLVSTERAGTVDPFSLPDADVEKDRLYASRLDETTVLRRRLHQIVFAASCQRLRKLDGLPIKRADILAKDGLYQVLVADGLLPELEETLVEGRDSPTQKEVVGEAPEQNYESVRSSRWGAEDSFA